MICTICGEGESNTPIKNLDLYTVGSEGTNVCFSCEMILVETIRRMMEIGNRSFLRGYKARKEAQYKEMYKPPR